ncbi:hypothetical protein EMIHUDRAFT_438115 [Emiliania huxleyi CCMP1516]|uniref:Uncharacterized protein n=2 Tax=Emiliania huxleyi TaxID=2903 RepID=A0A0D3IDC5_EMIH1|nr:hypothetical protein EMIHUDRAFT_438115 [Emiliania huxleyi CCMP1516]EOD09260.1 hypothetical protein EMIHUDRAFT_438115 [Emiliania huxleyi CCMP1516]|eukprot:XP_005761689.1 hypothetical protein EMIHUDRAFT_438115 [Emiliania huxleyi CCMP1516]
MDWGSLASFVTSINATEIITQLEGFNVSGAPALVLGNTSIDYPTVVSAASAAQSAVYEAADAAVATKASAYAQLGAIDNEQAVFAVQEQVAGLNATQYLEQAAQYLSAVSEEMSAAALQEGGEGTEAEVSRGSLLLLPSVGLLALSLLAVALAARRRRQMAPPASAHLV